MIYVNSIFVNSYDLCEFIGFLWIGDSEVLYAALPALWDSASAHHDPASGRMRVVYPPWLRGSSFLRAACTQLCNWAPCRLVMCCSLYVCARSIPSFRGGQSLTINSPHLITHKNMKLWDGGAQHLSPFLTDWT